MRYPCPSSSWSISSIFPIHNLKRAINLYRLRGFEKTPFCEGGGPQLHIGQAEDLIENRNPCGVYFYLADGTAAALEDESRAASVTILFPPRPSRVDDIAHA